MAILISAMKVVVSLLIAACIALIVSTILSCAPVVAPAEFERPTVSLGDCDSQPTIRSGRLPGTEGGPPVNTGGGGTAGITLPGGPPCSLGGEVAW